MKEINPVKNLLFIDIETVQLTKTLGELDERLQKEWIRKAPRFDKEHPPEDVYQSKAGIMAEFGKIITIGLGYFSKDKDGTVQFRVKAISGDVEKDVLVQFKELIAEKFDQKKLLLVAHNGKEFDYPYLCRRMLINGIPLPPVLNLLGKKPWEVPHYDTMEMWKFGELRHYVSLDLLATLFGLPSSKNDIDGSQVAKVYYEDDDLERIATYCQNDVVVTARVFLKMKSLPDLPEERIVRV
ncbi:3'-5' exonuclease [Flammeovirgaceae bacterium SG7u.111]|nr:3'-5' exonuclease [Flammeovirgaceae bacterium SG7u.132]WPO34228.1 3'-5' exonuclease [Flammeovirgaceae bacterium SG7u.111]